MNARRVTLCGLLLSALWAEYGHGGWQRFTAADGLTGSGVNAILAEVSGDLWFGTEGGGAVRSDGVSWITYASGSDLAAGSVTAMLQAHDAAVWFGTERGVRRLDGHAWTRWDEDDAAPADRVTALFEDASGAIWVGFAGQGAARHDGTSWTRFTTAEGVPGGGIIGILQDPAGSLWLAAENGVGRYDGAGWTRLQGLPGNRVRDMILDAAGGLWVATDGGAAAYRSGALSTFTADDGLVSNDLTVLLADASGNIWFGSPFGVSRFDGAGFTTFTENDGLAENTVDLLFEDGRGVLWAASPTSLSGISRFDGNLWTTVAAADGLGSQNTSVIAEDASGNVWFGTTFPTPGATLHDGEFWTSLTAAGGLAADAVFDVLVDRGGRVWFATPGGVTILEDGAFRILDRSDGLAGDEVEDLYEDRDGAIWIGTRTGVTRYTDAAVESYLEGYSLRTTFQDAGGAYWFGTTLGLHRLDGGVWTTFTTADGLVSDHVTAVAQELDGTLWFGTTNGVSRYDGAAFTNFRRGEGPVNNFVNDILVDAAGDVWFGTDNGIGIYDGAWTSITEAPGLASASVRSIVRTRDERLWFTTLSGISRFDGEAWVSFGEDEGLVGPLANGISEDASGALWIGTSFGASRFEPDRVPPRTVFPVEPPTLLPGRNVTIAFGAAWGETRGVRFSWSFDGGPWSPWSPETAWYGEGIPDGDHVFRVRARDGLRNVEAEPAEAVFEIDASAPQPVITSPVFREALQGGATVTGRADDARFAAYQVDLRPAGAASWQSPPAVVLARSSSPVTGGTLALWNTNDRPDGEYELRLAVTDTLGLTGSALVRIVLDNEPPFVNETSPLLIRAAEGGDVYTTNREAHLYLPPRALSQDAMVTLEPAGENEIPTSVGEGAAGTGIGFHVSLEEASVRKPGVIDIAAGEDGALQDLAVYRRDAAGTWTRLGGSLDAQRRLISASLHEPGLYALFRGGGTAGGPGRVQAVTLTPRAFSPRGGFGSRELAITLSLAGEAPVSVHVYNRAGRLVRRLADGERMTAGDNVVRWNGRDLDGALVDDGLYLVTVETPEETRKLTVAVVR